MRFFLIEIKDVMSKESINEKNTCHLSKKEKKGRIRIISVN